ncbi:MAG: DUF1501 domain-containing protein [Zavarzinella sp.]
MSSWSHLPRRQFLIASAASIAGITQGRGEQQAKGGQAKSTILFFLCGGASHIDTWDMKPDAPEEYRGPFQPKATTAPEISLSEHLPLLAQQAHHLAIIRSINGKVNTNDHHAGYYYNLTGHVPDQTFLTLGNNRTPQSDDWPFMGSVVAARKSRKQGPGAITLPHKPSKAPYTRPGQFAAKLGKIHDPLYVMGNNEKPLEFTAPALMLSGDVSAARLQHRKELLQAIDRAKEELATSNSSTDPIQEQAFSLLISSRATKAFDLESEPEKLRNRYGNTVNAMSLLLARRLVEAEVPFITVFWKENQQIAKKCRSAGGWDTHGNNFNCLKEHLLPEFDQAFSALIGDLAEKGLLAQTTVLVTSEMGRKPKIGDPRSGGTYGAGRDHWTYCLSNILAGGGIRGGQTYGRSDAKAEFPADKPVTPANIVRTIYHTMGIDDMKIRDRFDRPLQLVDDAPPLKELF